MFVFHVISAPRGKAAQSSPIAIASGNGHRTGESVRLPPQVFLAGARKLGIAMI
jgi:hypothetical protein